MRWGRTQQMIEEAGEFLETHPGASIMVVAATHETARIMLLSIWRRSRWRKELREPLRFRNSEFTMEFANGSRLSAVSARRDLIRGRQVDRLFVEDRVHDRRVITALLPTEWPMRGFEP